MLAASQGSASMSREECWELMPHKRGPRGEKIWTLHPLAEALPNRALQVRVFPAGTGCLAGLAVPPCAQVTDWPLPR